MGYRPKTTLCTMGDEGRTHAAASKEKGWRQIVRMELVVLNGLPGILTFNERGMQEVIALEIVDGLIAAMYVVRNPERFTGVTGNSRRLQ
jgi:RNA polymerase sigma-70 factor (ECF subfamily)